MSRLLTSRLLSCLLAALLILHAASALAEPVPDMDALDHAERLGGRAEWVSDDGHVARPTVQPDGDSAQLAWHALGSVQPETVRCPVCSAVYPADDEAADLPACPSCGTPDTWEARQDPAFRALIQETDGCASLPELAILGKRLYRLQLSHDQAGVAWSHYQVRKAKLEAEVRLRPLASALVRDIHEADGRVLPRFGAWLYRRQRMKGSMLSVPEWRRIWQAYHARWIARPA